MMNRELPGRLIAVTVLVILMQIGCEKSPQKSRITYTQDNPLVLKVSTYASKNLNWTRAAMWIYDEVEKRANGRLKFEYYYSGSLLPARETLAGLEAGVADIAVLVPEYHPGKVPLATVTSLPAISRYYYSTAMALPDLLNSPEVKNELDNYNVRYLSHAQNSSYAVWSKIPIRAIKDLKGRKVAVTGWHARLIKELGAVPVSIVSQEVYTSLQRGTVEAALANPTHGTDRKYYEVCPYFYRLFFGTRSPFIAVNRDSWERIPTDIRQIFLDLREESVMTARQIYSGAGEDKLAELAANGTVQIIEPSTDDVALVRDVAQSTIWKDWVAKMDNRGLPGQKVLDNWLDYVKKWEAKDPFIKQGKD